MPMGANKQKSSIKPRNYIMSYTAPHATHEKMDAMPCPHEIISVKEPKYKRKEQTSVLSVSKNINKTFNSGFQA